MPSKLRNVSATARKCARGSYPPPRRGYPTVFPPRRRRILSLKIHRARSARRRVRRAEGPERPELGASERSERMRPTHS